MKAGVLASFEVEGQILCICNHDISVFSEFRQISPAQRLTAVLYLLLSLRRLVEAANHQISSTLLL